MFDWLFVETVNSWEEVVYTPTTAGWVVLIAIVCLLIALMVFLIKKDTKKFTGKQIAYCGVALAIATVCSMIKFLDLPYGGSITLCSMLFVTLIGYWYGAGTGIVAAIAYGLLQFILEPQFYSIPQMLIDYIFAFGALGISGFFRNMKYGLLKGYIAAVLGRFVFAFISGVVFFGSYAPENMAVPIYSTVYNGSYIGVEALITIVILCIPAFSKGMSQIKRMAAGE